MPTEWLQIHLPVPADAIEAVSEQLNECGALAITLTPYEDSPLFQETPQAMPLASEMTLTALFDHTESEAHLMSQLKQLLPHEFLSLAETEVIAEKDWVSETQRQFEPTCFSNHLWVVPSWITQEYPQPVVYLDPGLGFGTGTHPTTALCLEWLATNTLTDKTVIDFGCGSGILSLAAAALGAQHVYAIDHDEQAITATTHNASLNASTEGRCMIGHASILPEHYQADIIVANILAKPLLTLLDTLTAHAKPNAQLILSGLLESDAPGIIACYSPTFDLIHQAQQGEWIRLDFKRNMKTA